MERDSRSVDRALSDVPGDLAPRPAETIEALQTATGYGTYTWIAAQDRFVDDSGITAFFGVPSSSLPAGSALQSLLGTVHPEDRKAVGLLFAGALSGRRTSFRCEHRVASAPSGGGVAVERWVETAGRAYPGPYGQAHRIVGTIADVTARRVEENARLRLQKLDAIGTMTSGIAHDFNNVLGPIISYAQLAEDEISRGLPATESLLEIQRAAERARQMVTRLLTYTRDEAPQRAAFLLNDVVGEACALVRPTLSPNTSLKWSPDIETCQVYGDATLLHQVVVNLLTNAGQAIGPDPGSIAVSIDQVVLGAQRPGVLADLDAGTYVRLRVADSGPGIAPHALDRLFDPFFTTKPAGMGTGLGLAAAQGAVRRHGGAITAENGQKGGATFTVYVPAEDPEFEVLAETATALVEPARSTRQLRVLFVDDDASLVQLARRALPTYNCSVSAHQDPVDALRTFRLDPDAYDVVITDFSMPTLNGLELAEQIRRKRSDLPIILTSGYLTAEDGADAKRAGISRVIPKPSSIAELAANAAELAATN